MTARDLIIGEQAPDLGLRSGPAPVFTAEQEDQIRQIVREQMLALRRAENAEAANYYRRSDISSISPSN